MSHAEPVVARPDPRASTVIALDDVASPAVKMGIGYWRRLAGIRPWPCREEISPADIRGLLRNLILLRVIDGGADFEYRIVGDAHVVAYDFCAQGKRLSELGDDTHIGVLRKLYGRVLRKQAAYAYRGWMARGEGHMLFSESAFLPLGPTGEIDHIVNFSAYTPTAF